MSNKLKRSELPLDETTVRRAGTVLGLVLAVGVIYLVLNPPPPPPPPGVQPITDCEPIVAGVPQDRLEPPDDAVRISIYFSAEECQYLPRIALSFNQAYIVGLDPLTGEPLRPGQPTIFVTGKPVSSGAVRDGLIRKLNGFEWEQEPPTIWSPSSSHFLAIVNEDVNREIFDRFATRGTALAPVAMAIWESRLQAIRNKVGYDDIGWEELLDVLNSPNGWCDYEILDCRPAVYYGHTNPYYSPTGLSTLIGEFYASARQNGYEADVLTEQMVNDPAVQAGVRQIEQLIRHYSRRTTEFKHYIAQGPEYVDFVALEENDIITINRGLTDTKAPERLIALYPKEGTFWHEHPFGIPNAPWVTDAQRDAARVFTDYVLSESAQALIVSEGFRPANPAVPIGFPFDPINGVTVEGPSDVLAVPAGEVIRAVLHSWEFVKKSADIVLLVDTSGSMSGNKLELAKQAAAHFVTLVSDDAPDNRVGLTSFSDNVTVRAPLTTVEGGSAVLVQAIGRLQIEDGTDLYSAIVKTVAAVGADEMGDRIRIVVLLSDGRNTTNVTTLNDTLRAIEASASSRNPVIVIPIAYGADADILALTQIAEASKTDVLNASDEQAIQQLLEIIASYG